MILYIKAYEHVYNHLPIKGYTRHLNNFWTPLIHGTENSGPAKK